MSFCELFAVYIRLCRLESMCGFYVRTVQDFPAVNLNAITTSFCAGK